MKHAKTEIKEGILLKSQIQATALILPDELDDLPLLMAALKRQNRRYIDAPKHEIMAAIRRGEVRHTQSLGTKGGCNKLVRGFYTDFFARLGGALSAPSSAQTLYIMKFALGTKYTPPSFTDTLLGNEIYRDTPDEVYDDTISTFYATTYLKKSEGNPTGNTTATAGNSTTITLTSATGFINGGRAQLETASNTYNFTYTVSGSILTCTDITGGSLVAAGAFDPADLPVATNTVIALHSEAGCFIGTAATSTLNTGNLMNHKQLEQLKTSGISLLYDFILACTSLE